MTARPGRFFLFAAAAALLLASCHHGRFGRETQPRAVVRDGVAVTVCDQKLTLFKNGQKVKDYDVSTSKFGIGSTNGSRCTPLGLHAVTKKTGEGQPKGMVFKGVNPTGEVVAVDAPGRDPVVTRVIQLAGVEDSNKNTHARRIYIHGTPEERNIGRPASYGCIRMKSDDIVDLYRRVDRGMPVVIEQCTQKTYMAAEKKPEMKSIRIPETVVATLPTDKQVRFRATGRRYTKGKNLRRRTVATASKSKGGKTAAKPKAPARKRSVAGSKTKRKK